ncbi:hypothetical protein GE061_012208 [Apolygus lucorum]|uniref:BTB domain-containing protein n=1 Tax=Apolygus lucorum TaxID=248454 RepID=A0A8S9XSU4_APOLU|nr:hypothetical protein GE061_012208 [Apolygus lucorum]
MIFFMRKYSNPVAPGPFPGYIFDLSLGWKPPYFRNVFKENPCEHPVVILKDVLPEDVEALLSFVYQGVVYVSETKLTSFLQTAELLQIKGLAGAASSFDAASSKLNSSADNANKRRKGAPVRIMKHDDGGEENSGSQMETEEEGVNDDMEDSKINDEDEDTGGEESENSGDVSGTTYNNYQIKEDFMAQMNQTKNESMSNFIQQSMARQLAQQQPNQIQQNRSTPPAPTGESPSQGSYQMSNTPNHGISAELLSPGERNGRRPCPQCTKVISNKSNLLKHIRIRHSDAYNPACCILCNKIFKNKYSLRAHLNIYHKEYISPNVQQQQIPTTPQTPQEQPTQQTYPLTPTTANQQYSLQIKPEENPVNNYA